MSTTDVLVEILSTIGKAISVGKCENDKTTVYALRDSLLQERGVESVGSNIKTPVEAGATIKKPAAAGAEETKKRPAAAIASDAKSSSSPVTKTHTTKQHEIHVGWKQRFSS